MSTLYVYIDAFVCKSYFFLHRHKTKACCTLDAKRANDFAPRNYQIVTKIGRFFFQGRGGGMKMSNMYLKS